jgi:hypothetical protein
MDILEWAFGGIGASLIVFCLGLVGVKAAQRRKKVRQAQRAGDNSSQIQSGRDTKVDL